VEQPLELLEIPYVERDGTPLLLTLVRPVGGKNLPILLNIHGGGWVAGCRDTTMSTMAHDRAQDGYLFLDVDYRLAPFHPYPAACDDLQAAVAWIAEHAASYGGDPTRIGVFGWSAGGHLAALLALTSPIPITCGVSWAGDMDLRDPPLLDNRLFPYGHAGCVMAFLCTCIHDHPQLYADVSPVNHLSPTSPPLLVIHGASDRVVTPSQARIVKDAAARTGAPVEVILIPDAGHIDPGPADPDGSQLWGRIRAFLAEHLLKSKE
jgi:triacylglycerol lipase